MGKTNGSTESGPLSRSTEARPLLVGPALEIGTYHGTVYTDMAVDPNKAFRYRLGSGPIKVLLGDKPKPAQTASPSSSTRQSGSMLHKTRHEDELIPFRRKGFVNFYDLGQKWDGSAWVDIGFSSLVETGAGGAANYQFWETHWHDLADMITATPTASWKTHFRKIEYEDAEKYGIDLRASIDEEPLLVGVGRVNSRKDSHGTLITGENWSDKGMKVPGAPLTRFGFQDYGAFDFLNAAIMGDSAGDCMQVTNTYDPMATPVSGFKLKGGENVFLMPRVVSMVARQYNGTTAYGTNTQTMIVPYQPLSREFWLNRSDPEFLPNIFSYHATPNITLNSTNSADLISWMSSRPGRVIWRTRWLSGTPTVDLRLTDPGGWTEVWIERRAVTLVDDRLLVSPVFDPDSVDYQGLGSGGPGITEGILMGVIEQSGTFYYFWRVVGGPNYVDSGGPCMTITLT